MGIQKFTSWLKQNYSDCFNQYSYPNQYKFDDIYIDMNFIIHSCYYGAESEDKLKLKIFEYIKGLMSKCKATKNLYLYFDGSAGKIKKNTCLKRIKLNSTVNEKISSKIFSHTSDFMKDINELSKILSVEYLNLNNNVNIIVNDSNNFGEAEIKIINTIIENKNNNHSVAIISNDSDTIIISLCSNINNITIFNRQYFINIDKLKQLFVGEYHTNYMDFVVLSLIQGNDYFPKLKYISFDSVWKAYNLYIDTQTLVNKGKDISIYQNGITNDNFKKYIECLIYCMPKQYRKCDLTTDLLIEIYNKKNYIECLNYCIDLYCSGKYKSETIAYNNIQLHPIVFLFN